MPDLIDSGSIVIPVTTLHDLIRAKRDGALADVPGLLERLDVPHLRALWPKAEVKVKP